MVVLADLTLTFPGNLGTATELTSAATELYDIARRITGEHVRAFPVSITVRVEQGSTKARTLVKASLAAVLVGLTKYGEIRDGIDHVRNDVGKALDEISRRSARIFEVAGEPKQTRRRAFVEDIAQIFGAVERGALSADEAMAEVGLILSRLPKEDREFGERFAAHVEPELRAIASANPQKQDPASSVIKRPQTRLIGSRETDTSDRRKPSRRRASTRDHPQRGRRIVVRVSEDENGKRRVELEEE
jgi:hypothetical protein